jgi:hypothetical protein
LLSHAIAPTTLTTKSPVINVLRFIGAIDEEGNKTSTATATFNQHDPAAFQKAFGEMVKSAYVELFNLHHDTAWELPLNDLIAFFRNNDQTSDAVGRRQASTFQALAGLSNNDRTPAASSPKNRDRGSGHPLAPPTPPYRRVRIRRFSKLSPQRP